MAAGVPVIGFSHVDPLEDTERPCGVGSTAGRAGFSHVDPLEDTESDDAALRSVG